MLNYTHEPTNTTVETTSGSIRSKAVTSGTPFVKMDIRTPYVDTSITAYDSSIVPPWTSQSIHLQTTSEVSAEVIQPDSSGPYVVVKLGLHDNVFVPIEMAEAIVDAMLDDETAAQLIYAEETAP